MSPEVLNPLFLVLLTNVRKAQEGVWGVGPVRVDKYFSPPSLPTVRAGSDVRRSILLVNEEYYVRSISVCLLFLFLFHRG